MARVHWLGAGLSAVPGLRRLIEIGRTVTVWNRTIDKAHAATEALSGDFRVEALTLDALGAAIAPGDVVVSMLPGTMHVSIAEICLEKSAHFVSSSYVSPELAALDQAFVAKGLVAINEVGLDPGIDHLLAHLLVDEYKSSSAYDPANTHHFKSYCGGFPKIANDFRYKFSWSPLGVLKALKSPAKSIRGGVAVDTLRPWHAVADYQAILPSGSETFQSYPNRDSLPFMKDYQFGDDWKVETFVRGTLRLSGWTDAWKHIFDEIETLEGDAGEKRLVEMSADLWDNYTYDAGEADRVVMCVDFEAAHGGKSVWHKSYVLDSAGDIHASAMARLVSVPVSLAVEAVLDGKLSNGVQAAPKDPATINVWLDVLRERGETIEIVDLLV